MKTLVTTDDRMGGLHIVYAIPPGAYSLSKNYATGKYTISFSNTDGVYALPCLAEDYAFSEQHERDENGDWWQPTVTGAIPHPDDVNAADIEAMERGEWVVLCEDQNGVRRLCGDDDTPLTFATDATSGMAATDRNQAGFTFTGKLGHPSWVMVDEE